MRGKIDEADALTYSPAFYAAIANGQSINSAHLQGQAAIQVAGGEDDLPYLACAAGTDPTATNLVVLPT